MSTASNIRAEATQAATIAGFAWLVVSISLAWVFIRASTAVLDPVRIGTDTRVLWEMTAWSGLASFVAIHVGRRLRETLPGPLRWPMVLGAVALVVLGALRFAPTLDIVILPAMWSVAAGVISLIEAALRKVRVAPPSIPDMSEPTGPAQERRPALIPAMEVDPTAFTGATIACPFLGLADDAATHFMFAAPGHRCHAASKPANIGLPHQGSFCLSGAFRECVRFPAEERAMPRQIPASAFAGQRATDDLAMLTSPIQRLRSAQPGGYVPPSPMPSPVKGNAVGRWLAGRAWLRRLIAVVLVALILAGAAWAIGGRGGVVAG